MPYNSLLQPTLGKICQIQMPYISITKNISENSQNLVTVTNKSLIQKTILNYTKITKLYVLPGITDRFIYFLKSIPHHPQKLPKCKRINLKRKKKITFQNQSSNVSSLIRPRPFLYLHTFTDKYFFLLFVTCKRA